MISIIDMHVPNGQVSRTIVVIATTTDGRVAPQPVEESVAATFRGITPVCPLLISRVSVNSTNA
jgi:hypothetical protein